jgi:3-hydroxy-D-aspartate aldolase
MNKQTNFEGLEVGYDIPALPGMAEADIQTPCLVLDLDALERKSSRRWATMPRPRDAPPGAWQDAQVGRRGEAAGTLGGSVGVCCQKVSEAEVFARGGIKDVLVSNQVRDPAKIDRLARLPKLGARTIVCVDDLANVADLSAAAVKHGTEIEVFVEIDCGAGRCGVKTPEEVVAIAKAVAARRG